MPNRYLVAAFLFVLSASALIAQDYSGYPENRMRMGRPDNQNVFMPDLMYTENRVVLRSVDVTQVGRGMQISGEILTDFEADQVPMSEQGVPRGQLRDIRIDIELYYIDAVVERDPATNKAKTPKFNPRSDGHLVDGQITTVQPTRNLGIYGLASFTLPALDKPLAPGLYRLVARVRFGSQNQNVQKALKWMSDWYGAEVEVTQVGNPPQLQITTNPVMADPKLHEKVYQDLMTRTTQVRSDCEILVGEVWKDGALEVIPAESGTTRKPANIALWTPHASMVEQVSNYEHQLDNVDAVIDAELEEKLKLDGINDEMRERFRKEAEEQKARIRRDNPDLIERHGGRVNREEVRMLATAKTARETAREQVLRFHEYLAYRYWVLVDGLLTYDGWHTINVPGYNVWDAIQKQDQMASRVKRQNDLAARRESPGGLEGRRDELRQTWQYVAPEISGIVFAYFRTKEERADWDADKFTVKRGDNVELDLDKWAEFREEFIIEFHKKTELALEAVTTTNVYATQTWLGTLTAAREARDDVIRSTYAWEYLIRTDSKNMAEDGKAVAESWRNSATQTLEGIDLSQYYSRGQVNPGTLKTRFDSGCNTIRRDLGFTAFAYVYREAVKAEVDRRSLPGRRPSSAPTKD